MRGVCTCASVQLIGNENWKPYIFSNYWRSRITNFRHRSPEYIFAFPGPRFWFIPLASGRSNPVSRQQSLRIPDFRRYFSSQIPDPEIRVPFERTKKSKEKLKQRNNQSKATYTNFYLFIFIVFRDRFWTGHKFVTQTCWLKTWPLLITVLKCHSLYIMLLPAIQRHYKSRNAYFSFHRHWFRLQWDVADKTFRYFLPNSDLFYLTGVRTDKCRGKKNIQRVSLISTSFDLGRAT